MSPLFIGDFMKNFIYEALFLAGLFAIGMLLGSATFGPMA